MIKSVPMDLGNMQQGRKGLEEGDSGKSEDEGEGNDWDVDAVNKHVKCCSCGGYGHYARNCAWDEKKMGNQGTGGKGKGGPPYGKGSLQGGKGSTSFIPQVKGKGK